MGAQPKTQDKSYIELDEEDKPALLAVGLKRHVSKEGKQATLILYRVLRLRHAAKPWRISEPERRAFSTSVLSRGLDGIIPSDSNQFEKLRF